MTLLAKKNDKFSVENNAFCVKMAFYWRKILQTSYSTTEKYGAKNYFFHQKMANFHPKIFPKPTFKKTSFISKNANFIEKGLILIKKYQVTWMEFEYGRKYSFLSKLSFFWYKDDFFLLMNFAIFQRKYPFG